MPLYAEDTSLTSPSMASSEMPKKDTEDQEPFVLNSIKEWVNKVNDAKKKWKADFDRMMENMAFVAGMQWNNQTMIRSDKYVSNLTIRAINQKVATLYARDPQIDVKTREKLNYEIWDGTQESLVSALSNATLAAQSGQLPQPQDVAVINDFQQGKEQKKLVEKVAKTLKTVYQYQVDTQEPEFKTQAKQFVRRAAACGVAYIRVNFCRDYENELSQSETRSSIQERLKSAKYILQRYTDGEIDESSPELETLRSLVESTHLEPSDAQSTQVKERLVFDFPPANSIIPDPDCRALKGFVGAKWVAEEYILPLSFVNSFFECDIKPGSDVKFFNEDGSDYGVQKTDDMKATGSRRVRLYEVFDLTTRSTFIICDGYTEKYIVSPASVISTSSFWPIFALTFNDIETVPGSKATIFPPSDVDLIMSAQKEWNRTRQGLRNQRKANAVKYMAPKGALSENDLDNIANAEDNQVIQLEQLPPGTEPGKILQPLQHAPIDMAMYDTEPLKEDIMYASGNQGANLGPAQPNVTATVGSIAEQSRQTETSSNVDDLDDCLSAVARCGGELLIRNMSEPTVARIVGVGYAWPTQQPEDFLNEISLEIKVGSSGRPNKAIEIQNFQQIAPLLLQAGANPIAVIKEAVRRLDDRMDVNEFFPLPGQQQMLAGGGPQNPSAAVSTPQSPMANANVPAPAMPPMQTNSPMHN